MTDRQTGRRDSRADGQQHAPGKLNIYEKRRNTRKTHLKRRQLKQKKIPSSAAVAGLRTLQLESLRGYTTLARLLQLEASQQILAVEDLLEIQLLAKFQLQRLLEALLCCLRTHHQSAQVVNGAAAARPRPQLLPAVRHLRDKEEKMIY